VSSVQLSLFEWPPPADSWRAWVAAILDGEGWIGITRGGRNMHPNAAVEVKMCDPQVVRRLHARYAGVLSLRPTRSETRRSVWSWRVSGRLVVPVLEDALPFLLIKEEQAKIAIDVGGRSGVYHGRTLPEDELAWRVAHLRRMRVLNRRGVDREPA
jgi:hypothetical protein